MHVFACTNPYCVLANSVVCGSLATLHDMTGQCSAVEGMGRVWLHRCLP